MESQVWELQKSLKTRNGPTFKQCSSPENGEIKAKTGKSRAVLKKHRPPTAKEKQIQPIAIYRRKQTK